jgi:hypothetical protein
MSEQEHNLHVSADYYTQEQTAAVSVHSSTFIPQLSVSTNLFEQLKSEFFNEMLDDKSFNAEASKKIEQWLSIRSLDELRTLGIKRSNISFIRESHSMFMAIKRVLSEPFLMI